MPPFLHVGGAATVTADGVNLRAQPTTAAAVLGSLTHGASFTVVDGPQTGSGHEWWKGTVAGGKTGWVAEEFLEPA